MISKDLLMRFLLGNSICDTLGDTVGDTLDYILADVDEDFKRLVLGDFDELTTDGENQMNLAALAFGGAL